MKFAPQMRVVRGAEIDEHTAEIERVRDRLARLVANGNYEGAA